MSEAADADLVEIRIRGLPVQVWAQAQEHSDELVREFTLISRDQRDDTRHDVPARLTQLIDTLTGQYGAFTQQQEAELAAAAADGLEQIDLTFTVPSTVGEAVVQLAAILDEADDYCRQGEHLLTLETQPEALAFRRWYLEEFLRQSRGEPPMTWEEYRAR